MGKKTKIINTLKLLFCMALIITYLISIIIIKVRFIGKRFILKEIPKNVEVILVLGAGVKEDGNPSDILKDRLDTSLDVLKENKDAKVIVSGDHGRVNYDEVSVMKDILLKGNVKEENIFKDHAGFSTYESIYRAKEIFKVKNMLIVTNSYHLPRALYLAREMGIEAYGFPSDKRDYYYIDAYKKRESLAQVKDFFYVNILKPEPSFLGDEIPVSTSNGIITDDKNNNK